MLRRLWTDDHGAIISTEFVLLMGLMVMGLIPGMVYVRDNTVARMQQITDGIGYAVPQPETVRQQVAVRGSTAVGLTVQQTVAITIINVLPPCP